MDFIELGSRSYKEIGKAGKLNKIYDDFNIAKGVIITDDYFKRFLSFNKLNIGCKSLEEEIKKGKLPYESKLMDLLKKNNLKRLIVRSSASVEDGDKQSYAGQFSSYLDISLEQLEMYIKKCWISMIKDYVLEYKQGLMMMDVLIQEYIETEVSGVAFAVNPSTGKKETFIEAYSGSCEDIVAGKVIPHHYDTSIVEGDNILLEKQIEEIKEILRRLKTIFNKDLEIEFGYRKGEFYLFQVRPITKVSFSLKKHLKEVNWGDFKNNDWNLFDRTLWILGAQKYKNKIINNDIPEDVCLYYPYNEKQIRGFDTDHKLLDNITLERCKREDIVKYIDEYDKVIKLIRELSEVIRNNIDDDDFVTIRKNIKKILKYNGIINSYEYLIGALGQTMYDELDEEVLMRFNKWRNSDDAYFPIYNDIFDYVIKHFDMVINRGKLRRYIHANELVGLCDGKLRPEIILKRVDIRGKRGFILLNLNRKNYTNKVIVDNSTIEVLKNKFENNREKRIADGIISGKSTIMNGKIIEGECVVLKANEDMSKVDVDKKILICDITTAKDVKYLKTVKAIIADSGGILCHSAIFSREFNIPCLMGCVSATNYFKTGDKVLYDVDNEYVKRI